MRYILAWVFMCVPALITPCGCASSGGEGALSEPVLLYVPDNKDEAEKVETEKKLGEPDEDVFDDFEDNPDTFVREDSIDYMTAHTGLEDDPETTTREDLVPMGLREKRAKHLRQLRRLQNAPK